jgi:hypothetical protein
VQRWRRFFVLDDDVDPFENLHLLTRLACLSLAGLSVQYATSGWLEGDKGPYPLPVHTVNQLLDATADTLSYLDPSNVPLNGDELPNYAKGSAWTRACACVCVRVRVSSLAAGSVVTRVFAGVQRPDCRRSIWPATPPHSCQACSRRR